MKRTLARTTQTADYLAMVRRIIRAAGRRVGSADPEDLQELIELQVTLDLAIREAVHAQRLSGITWQSIGDATGTSRQAAIQKWAES